MAYQAPITIKQVLERIHRHDYVLPAIQREFVWEPDQVCRLFDSLLRGYPIGTFLFWNVREDLAREFQFYDVMREYHEAKARHSPKLSFPQARNLVAILDGQQRLSSLNIGLCGSYATKLPRKRVDDPDAYPARRLHLDLLHTPVEDDDVQFRFAFLSDSDLDRSEEEVEHWYPVREVLDLTDHGPAIFAYLNERGLTTNERAFPTLAALWTAIHQNPVISFFEEEEQSLPKVLDIFIRVNSGGTVLSKSDLLLSIATAQFDQRDAREAIHGLVDDLNATPPGFSLSKDLVLKTGLVLAGVSDSGFKVENFTKANMAKLDAEWDDIDQSLRIAVKIISSFGLSARTLSAASVVIPVADYVHSRGLTESYLTSAVSREDLAGLRSWVLRSLIKPGIWGSALDGLLRALHAVIRGSEGGFPAPLLEAEMARFGKSLNFDEELLQDLVDSPYKHKRIFPLLTLLYPGVDTRNEFHEDHIFPKSLFTKPKLTKAGFSPSEIEAMQVRFDRLPNLQLLPGIANVHKSAVLPGPWIEEHQPDPVARSGWLASYDMHDLPPGLDGFVAFYDNRRARMLARLREVLSVPKPTAPSPTAAERAEDETEPATATPVQAVDSPLLILRGSGIEARGRVLSDGFVVLEGSQATLDTTNSIPEGIARMRSDLIADGSLVPEEDFHRFTRDVEFSSPSSAAGVTLGASVNGRDAWRDSLGRSVKSLGIG